MEKRTYGFAIPASLFVLFFFASIVSCQSDLLGTPPSTVAVSLTAEPTVTKTYSTAVIACTTTAAATVSVEYGTASGTYTLAIPRSTTEGTSHSVSLTGLSASTTYYYRVVSWLSGTRYYNSSEYSFTTASAQISLLSAPTETVAYDSATIAFTTSANATVSVEYGTAAGTYTLAVPRTSTEGTSHSVSLTSLSASTTYYYRVVSWLNGALSSNSAEYTFTTNASPVSLSITAGPTVTAALTSLTIAFTTNNACTSVVEYGTVSGTYTASTLQTTTAATSHSASLTSLSSGTTYYYRIKLYWNTGSDYVSSEYTMATTAETAPTAAQKARGIWIIGGLSGPTVSTVVSAIDLYDPVTNTWYPAAATTTGYTPVSFAAYAAYGGKLYVFGGFDSTGAVRNLTQIYTIATNTWSSGAVLPVARANIFASILNDKIYILGGTTAAATTNWAGSATTYEYSTSGNSWVSTKVAFGTAGSERFSYAYDGTVYNLGGRTSNIGVVSTHDGLLPSTVAQPINGELDGAGVAELAMSAVRGGFTGGVYKPSTTPAFVYVIGGLAAYTGVTGCFVNFPTTISLTPINTVQYMHYPFASPRTWVTGVSYPVSVAHGASVVTTAFSPARIIYFGGTTSLGASAAGQANGYWIPTPPDPMTTWADTWTAISTTNMSARWGQGAVTLNQ